MFKRIEDIEVWKRGCRLAVTVYQATSDGGFAHDWGLRDQIRRSAVSIPANVAEGFERGTNAEFNHFLMISRGSCGELRTHIYIAEAIGYFDKEQSRKLVAECLEISSMLIGLSKTVRVRPVPDKPKKA